jgi:hypothetical protein
LSRLRYSLLEARTARSMTKGPALNVKRADSAFWKVRKLKLNLFLEDRMHV